MTDAASGLGGTKKKKGAALVLVGLGALLLMSGKRKASGAWKPSAPPAPAGGVIPWPTIPGTEYPPPQPTGGQPTVPVSVPLPNVPGVDPAVIARTAAAIMSGNPATMRAEAAKLRKEGYLTQATDLEGLAAQQEAIIAAYNAGVPVPPLPPKPVTPAPPLAPPVVPPYVPPVVPPYVPPVVAPPPAPTAPRVLKAGMTGLDVKAWQTDLRDAGFPTMLIDGTFGPQTDRATRDFQIDSGVPVDGYVGPVTLAARGKPPVLGKRLLKLSSEGPAVRSWHIALSADGFKAPTYGLFDAGTDTATRQYQRDRNLAADGIVGPLTWAAVGPKAAGALIGAAASKPLTITPSTWRSPLKEGMTGNDVGEWQLVLQRDVDTALKIDKAFGPITKARTITWQKARGLTADGAVGPLTRTALGTRTSFTSTIVAGSVALLTSPSSAPDELAVRLSVHLATATRGREDRTLVQRFQAAQGLKATGAYGPGTAAALLGQGLIPAAPFYWSGKGSSAQRSTYRRELEARAELDPMRADEWRAALRGV
jgi:peptidoglycan hydrolase-like protein with peptidoglycan-binding domain